jgi:hypothetical protein
MPMATGMAGIVATLSATPARSNQSGVSITPGIKYARVVAITLATAA